MPAAYFTARHTFRGRQVFLYVVLATQMFAPVILVIGIYREFVSLDTALQESGFGAINTYWSIIAVNVFLVKPSTRPGLLESTYTMRGDT